MQCAQGGGGRYAEPGPQTPHRALSARARIGKGRMGLALIIRFSSKHRLGHP